MFFLLMCLIRSDSCSYISPRSMENSKLCSFWIEKSCVLVDFKEKMFVCTKVERKSFVGGSYF